MSRRQIFSLFFIFLLLLGGGTLLVLRQTGAAKGMVHELLSKVIRGDLLRLRDADFDLTSGRMTVNQLEIRDPELAATEDPILAVDKMEVDVETNPLGEVGAVRRVRLEGLNLKLDLSAGETPNFGRFLQEAGIGAQTSSGTMSLPALEVHDSKVDIRFAPGQAPVPFHDLNMEILPLEADPKRMQITGRMLSPLGETAEITGSGNPETGDWRALVKMEKVPLRPDQARAFHPRAAELLRANEMRGMATSVTIWMERSAVEGGHDTQGGISAELTDLQIRAKEFPYPLVAVRGRLNANLADGGTLHFELHKNSADADLHAKGQITAAFSARPQIDVEVRLEDLLLGETFVQALQASQSDLAQRVDRALRPRGGRVDVRLRMHNPKDELKLVAEASFKGVSAAYHGFVHEGQRIGFPYPLRDVQGKLRVEPDRLILDGIRAVDSDGKPLRIAGEINYVDDRPFPQLRILGEGLRFSPAIREALGSLLEDGEAIYDEYAPQGDCDVEVLVDHSATGGRHFEVELRPREASAAYLEFPYRVPKLTGSIKIAASGVEVDLRGGRSAAQPVSIHGRFLFDAEREDRLRSELWIKGKGLPLDADLQAACGRVAPSVPAFWDFARPRGQVDAEVTLWAEAGESKLHYDIHLGVRDSSVSLQTFPLPIENIRGDVFIHGIDEDLRCDLSPLRGEIVNGRGQAPARVLVQGTVRQSARGVETDVTSIVQDLRLGEGVGEALRKSGTLDARTWQELQLGGLIDVTAHQRKGVDDTGFNQRFQVHLRGVESRAAFLPGRAHDLRGEIVVEDGKAQALEIHGKLDETGLRIDAGLLSTVDNAIQLECRVTATDFPVDDRLARMLGGSARERFLARRWRGRVDLNGVTLQLRFPLDGSASNRAGLSGDLQVRDLSFDCGLPEPEGLRHVSGMLRIEEASIDSLGAVLKAQLVDGGLQLAGTQLHDLGARVDLRDEELRIYRLNCSLAGGKLRAAGPEDIALYYKLSGAGQLMAWLRFSDMSLQDLLRSRGLMLTKVRGDLAGELIIAELVGDDFLNMEAHGEVLVGNGRLGTVPIFAAIYSHLKAEHRPQFTAGKAAFKIHDQRIDFTELNARSDLFKVEGSGTLDMDGFLDVRLNIPQLFGSAASILILPPLLNKVVSELVSFQVYGNIRSPRAQPLWLGSRPKGRPGLRPIPPIAR